MAEKVKGTQRDPQSHCGRGEHVMTYIEQGAAEAGIAVHDLHLVPKPRQDQRVLWRPGIAAVMAQLARIRARMREKYMRSEQRTRLWGQHVHLHLHLEGSAPATSSSTWARLSTPRVPAHAGAFSSPPTAKRELEEGEYPFAQG